MNPTTRNTVIIDVKTMRECTRKNGKRMALLLEYLKCPTHVSIAKFIRKRFSGIDCDQNHLEHMLGDIKPLAVKLKEKKLDVEYIAIRINDLLADFLAHPDLQEEDT